MLSFVYEEERNSRKSIRFQIVKQQNTDLSMYLKKDFSNTVENVMYKK